MKINKYIFIILIFLLFSCLLYSHPHVFPEALTEFVFNENGLYRINIKWIFDPNFSFEIISYCDLNRDNKFDEEDRKLVYADYFKNLKDFDYFIFIKIDGKEIKTVSINDFYPVIEKDTVVYTFFIPLEIQFKPDNTNLRIKFYDPTYFVAFSYEEDGIEFTGNAKISDLVISSEGDISFSFKK